MSRKLRLPLYPLIVLFFIACVFCGGLAFISLLVSIFLLYSNRNKVDIWIYCMAVFLSLCLSFIPFIGHVSRVNLNGYAIYGDIAAAMVPETECPQLKPVLRDEYNNLKTALPSLCAVLSSKNNYHDVSSLAYDFYAAVYTPFSVASFFIPLPPRKDECIQNVKRIVTLCPNTKEFMNTETINFIYKE
ncbi:hypothetical protein [Pantoea sp. S62]|uniref:hypothetical protein n=1 Tax=Pantoea sp. S62 TaxID=2769342 RepID=UPI0019116F0C|nr:hypothetical protein [Pantoea sp. S62]MBK5017162.1 hypothetical protein [Pantoea sp. S62]